ncbi:hypothetical protein KM043_013426 [Ampulex compressa]|nr:hypothetical protein KM043_013426 [Ampulex compressa]
MISSSEVGGCCRVQGLCQPPKFQTLPPAQLRKPGEGGLRACKVVLPSTTYAVLRNVPSIYGAALEEVGCGIDRRKGPAGTDEPESLQKKVKKVDRALFAAPCSVSPGRPPTQRPEDFLAKVMAPAGCVEKAAGTCVAAGVVVRWRRLEAAVKPRGRGEMVVAKAEVKATEAAP